MHLASLDLDEQVRLVCECPVSQRSLLLSLAAEPERLIPALPEAELCFSIKAAGLHDAAWIVEHATTEQIQACLDLDLCSNFDTNRAAMDEWFRCLCEAGDDALLKAARELDPELWILWLKDRLEVVVRDADASAWQAPAGAKTIDGVFFLLAQRANDDLSVPVRLLTLLFTEERDLYERFLQGVRYELISGTEEWAFRWREGRLEDLGFPRAEEAASIYARVPERQWSELPERGARPEPWTLPVWAPRLPAARDARHSLLRAAAELDPEEGSSFFFAYLALANKVARADRMPLGDAESIPAAMEKVARVASLGLDALARRHDSNPAEVLRRAPLEFLFRVGVTLDPGEGAK